MVENELIIIYFFLFWVQMPIKNGIPNQICLQQRLMLKKDWERKGEQILQQFLKWIKLLNPIHIHSYSIRIMKFLVEKKKIKRLSIIILILCSINFSGFGTVRQKRQEKRNIETMNNIKNIRFKALPCLIN